MDATLKVEPIKLLHDSGSLPRSIMVDGKNVKEFLSPSEFRVQECWLITGNLKDPGFVEGLNNKIKVIKRRCQRLQ